MDQVDLALEGKGGKDGEAKDKDRLESRLSLVETPGIQAETGVALVLSYCL